MPNEKYLNYAGLQYYHEKLNLDLANMLMTDDDLDIILLNELGIVPPIPETWTESANGTLNLALGDAFSYWPEGAGTKTISITNGTTAGISKFFLKLTDAGNFFVEWGSNIQWKNGSEPEWQAFHEDIVLFTSNNGGSTWTGQVVQTNEITPYWKITVQTTSNNESVIIPFECEYIKTIDWGDGNIDDYEYSYVAGISEDNYDIPGYSPKHTYATIGYHKIKIISEAFTGCYIQNCDSCYSNESHYYNKLISIDSPLPELRGTYTWPSSYAVATDNSFEYIFTVCKQLVSIPEKLFYNNPYCNTFYSAFDSCSSLQSIPSGLFDKNTAVTSFYGCFYNCSSIQSIPAGLFDKNTAVTDFNDCFNGCSSIQSIPAGLFDKNTRATNFTECFYRCTSLQSIPSGLFDKNTRVTNFNSCFSTCSSLQSIPAGLFDNNTAVTTFNWCFYNCTSLQFIPSGLFNKNTVVTIFIGCFSDCNSLTDFTLHIGSSSVSNCNNFVNNKSGTTRTIYVPSGSTTQTTFNSVASSLGLTIVGV